MRRALLVMLLVAACKKEPATCPQVGPAILAWGRAEIAGDKLVGDAATQRQALFQLTSELYPRVCEKSRWSGEAIDCLIAARTEEDAQRCPLTKDQRDDLQKALMDALSADTPTGAPVPTDAGAASK